MCDGEAGGGGSRNVSAFHVTYVDHDLSVRLRGEVAKCEDEKANRRQLHIVVDGCRGRIMGVAGVGSGGGVGRHYGRIP